MYESSEIKVYASVGQKSINERVLGREWAERFIRINFNAESTENAKLWRWNFIRKSYGELKKRLKKLPGRQESIFDRINRMYRIRKKIEKTRHQ